MAITVPTRTPGSLGSTKSNNSPVTNETQQLAASDYNTCADKLIEVINQSNGNIGLVETQTKGDATSGLFTFDVSAIPADYDLQFTWACSNPDAVLGNLAVTFNGDSAGANTNYIAANLRVVAAGGTSLPGDNGVNQDYINAGLITPRASGGATVDDFGYGSFRIPFTWKTTGKTSIIGESFCTDGDSLGLGVRGWVGGNWKTQVAVTQIDFRHSGGQNFDTGSTITMIAKPKGTL